MAEADKRRELYTPPEQNLKWSYDQAGNIKNPQYTEDGPYRGPVDQEGFPAPVKTPPSGAEKLPVPELPGPPNPPTPSGVAHQERHDLNERLREVVSKIREEDGKRYKFKEQGPIGVQVTPAQTSPPIGGVANPQEKNPIDTVTQSPQDTGVAGTNLVAPTQTAPSPTQQSPQGSLQPIPDPGHSGQNLPGYEYELGIGKGGHTAALIFGPGGVQYEVGYGPGTGYGSLADALGAFGTSVDEGNQLADFGGPTVGVSGTLQPGDENGPGLSPNPNVGLQGGKVILPSIYEVSPGTWQIFDNTGTLMPESSLGVPNSFSSQQAALNAMNAWAAIPGHTGTGTNYQDPPTEFPTGKGVGMIDPDISASAGVHMVEVAPGKYMPVEQPGVKGQPVVNGMDSNGDGTFSVHSSSYGPGSAGYYEPVAKTPPAKGSAGPTKSGGGTAVAKGDTGGSSGGPSGPVKEAPEPHEAPKSN